MSVNLRDLAKDSNLIEVNVREHDLPTQIRAKMGPTRKPVVTGVTFDNGIPKTHKGKLGKVFKKV